MILRNQHHKIHHSVRACREVGMELESVGREVLTPVQSAQAVLKVIAQLEPQHSGKFLNYAGDALDF